MFIGEKRFVVPIYSLDYFELLLNWALDLALMSSVVSREELRILLKIIV
jgi:hypothetical protein